MREHMIEKSIPPPVEKKRKRRLTPELKAMVAGDSACLDRHTAGALVAYGRYHKWEMTQESQTGGKVRVWRVK